MAWMIAAAIKISTDSFSILSRSAWLAHTLRRRVLAEVFGLVTAENASGLDLGGRTSGELLVKVDHAPHRDGVGVGADRLFHASASQKISSRASCSS